MVLFSLSPLIELTQVIQCIGALEVRPDMRNTHCGVVEGGW